VIESTIIVMLIVISVITCVMVLSGIMFYKQITNIKRQTQRQINQLIKVSRLRHKTYQQSEDRVSHLELKQQNIELGLQKMRQSLDQSIHQTHLPVSPALDHKRVVALMEKGIADVQTLQSMGYSRSEAQLMSHLVKLRVSKPTSA